MLDEVTVYDIPMNEIFADEDFNVRGEIAPNSVLELARDIRSKGLLQPITLQPWVKEGYPGIKYRIIAGHRRFLAHQLNQATTIKALMRLKLSDVEAVAWNLVENLHRADLNKFQEAMSVKRLKMMGMTEMEAAARIGKSRGWVQVRYMILSLPYEIQEEVANGLLTDQQIRECYSLNLRDDQIEFVKRVKDAKILGKKKMPTANKVASQATKLRNKSELIDLQQTIQHHIGNNLTTVVIGWAIGENTNNEVHEAIKQAATEAGVYYQVPTSMSYKTKVEA